MDEVKQNILTEIETSIYQNNYEVDTVLVNPEVYQEIKTQLEIVSMNTSRVIPTEDEPGFLSTKIIVFFFSGLCVEIKSDPSVSFLQKYTLKL